MIPGAKYGFHSDWNLSIPLLNDLLISFRWRPLINKEFVADLEHWAISKEGDIPDFLFLGIYNTLCNEFFQTQKVIFNIF